MRSLVAIFSVLLCSFALYHQTDGLKCYVCAGDCSDSKEFECDTSTIKEWVCESSTVTADDGAVKETIKACIPKSEAIEKGCKAIDNIDPTDRYDIDVACYTCASDLCNSAGIYSISALLLASLFFILMKM